MGTASPSKLLADLYSAGAPQYAALWAPVLQPMGQHLVAAMPLADARTVLDLGAGTGALLPALHAAAGGAMVVGADLAIGMLRVVRERLPSTPLVVTDIGQLGFGASSVDAVVLAFVLALLPKPIDGLAEVRRVLRPGGIVGLTTWGQGAALPDDPIWGRELDACGARPDAKPDAVKQDPLMDTTAKVGALLEAAGLVSPRIWVERPERRWTWAELLHLGTQYGATKRRLGTLDPDGQQACLARVRAELSGTPNEALVHRPEVIFAIAHRP